LQASVSHSVISDFPSNRVRFGYALVKFAMDAFTRIPFRTRYRLGETLGLLVYRFDATRKQVAIRNLELAFPQWEESRRLEVARQAFINFGRLIMEFVQCTRLTPADMRRQVTFENLDLVREAKARGKGIIFQAAHFGNWEFGGLAVSTLVEPLDVVARPLDSKILEMLLSDYRAKQGNRVIKSSGGAREIVRALKANRMVAILMDQNQIRSHGIFADFFGIPASTTPAIAMIARKTGSAVIPAFLVREGFQKYRQIFREEVFIDRTKDKGQDALTNTTRLNRVIEEMVREYPEQYFWLHRRWRTRPRGEPKIY